MRIDAFVLNFAMLTCHERWSALKQLHMRHSSTNRTYYDFVGFSCIHLRPSAVPTCTVPKIQRKKKSKFIIKRQKVCVHCQRAVLTNFEGWNIRECSQRLAWHGWRTHHCIRDPSICRANTVEMWLALHLSISGWVQSVRWPSSWTLHRALVEWPSRWYLQRPMMVWIGTFVAANR